ncbi:ectomycorrhizas secreted protein, partial [Phlegmacium glaucopus]
LSVQSTRALLCLGVWSLMGYVKDASANSGKSYTVLPEVDGEEEELADNWDSV